MKQINPYLLGLVVLVFLIKLIRHKETTGAEDDWIVFPEMKDVPLDKTFTVEFYLPVTTEDYDSIGIYHKGEFVPVEIVTTGREAKITPVYELEPDTDYEIRVMVGKQRYKMIFYTTPEAGCMYSIKYEGIAKVKSRFADDRLIEGIHHYVLDMGEGHPINLYVTDDYEARYGKGFAYLEVGEMMESIHEYKQFKPYTTKYGALDIYFYTNESGTPLPDRQAAAGSWSFNYGEGVQTEILINGSNLDQVDFRVTLLHELYHYYDFQSFISQHSWTYEKYWGPNYRFWLVEGGAEYASYFMYEFPKNIWNSLPLKVIGNNKESIIQYARQQGFEKEELFYQMEFNTFNDLYKGSPNNYGISLSFFWYLVEQYGYRTIYAYVQYIGDTFIYQSTITREEKEETAIRFFGKTEKQILQDWLNYFNYFRKVPNPN